MPIQVIECPACRGDIEFYDEGRMFGRCTCCGREVQRTEFENVTVQGERDHSNQVIKQGMDHVEMEHYVTAEELFEQYIEKNPKRYEGYYGMLLVHTYNFDIDSIEDEDDLDTILSDMADIRKTADAGTVSMIQARLDQMFSEYRVWALQEARESLEEKQSECAKLEEIVRSNRDEGQVEQIRAQIQASNAAHTAALAKMDNQIKNVEKTEKHKKLIIWIISLLVLMISTFQKSRDPFIKPKTFFFKSMLEFVCACMCIGIPVYCVKNRGGYTSTPIANRLRKKRNDFSRTPYLDKGKIDMVNIYDANVRKLAILLKEKDEMTQAYEEMQKMSIEDLVEYFT